MWQGAIWRAMARYGVLWRVFFRLRHSFLLYVMSFLIGDTSILVFVNFLLLVIELILLKVVIFNINLYLCGNIILN